MQLDYENSLGNERNRVSASPETPTQMMLPPKPPIAQLNLLQITAIISSTSTVIMQTVIIRFVAILPSISISLLKTASPTGLRDDLPTRHPPQRLHTPIHIPLTLQQRRIRMLNRLPLPMQIRQRTRPNRLCIIRERLTRL